MPSSPSSTLRLELQATGEGLNSWGATLNDNALVMLEEAITKTTAIALTGNRTLTTVNYTTDEARSAVLIFTDGGLSAIPTVTLPAVSNIYYVENQGATYAITFDCGGTTASLPASRKGFVRCDGTNVYAFDPVADSATQAAAAAASAVLASEWATQLTTAVSGSDYSAKENAVGTSVPTGSAKSWATITGAAVADSEYSAKEYAQGTTATGGTSKEWAQTTGAEVAGGEYAAKEYAVGTTVSAGSSKLWATKTGSAVSGTDYSAKEHAIGDETATGGSAKAWATDTSSPDGTTTKSALTWAGESASSAAASASSASAASDSADEAAASAAAAATYDPATLVPRAGDVSLTGNVYDAVVDKGSFGSGTCTFDVSDGQRQKMTVTGGTVTIALSGKPTTGWGLAITLINGGLGTISWPTTSWKIGDGEESATFADMGVTLQSSGSNIVILWSEGSGTVYGRAG
ncbi:hypothetical protein [Aurantimonas coralicida]|uniref:hypothetical protein n=1 Tax=Aurantimonas coralicida TaxID=182270 RepID=UPI001E5D1894|nr:hypothetical protein [Aurantimonas coralicida]MCD1644159.1 hypothetical protein [Aurantimonas coralicida]